MAETLDTSFRTHSSIPIFTGSSSIAYNDWKLAVKGMERLVKLKAADKVSASRAVLTSLQGPALVWLASVEDITLTKVTEGDYSELIIAADAKFDSANSLATRIADFV